MHTAFGKLKEQQKQLNSLIKADRLSIRSQSFNVEQLMRFRSFLAPSALAKVKQKPWSNTDVNNNGNDSATYVQ